MRLCRRHGVRQQLGLLVVGRDEDVDGRQFVVRHRWRARGAAASGMATTNRLSASIMTLYISAEIEQEAGNEVFRLVDRRQRAGGAPVDVAQHDRGAEGRARSAARCRPGVSSLEHAMMVTTDKAGDQLGLQADRQCDQQDDDGRNQCPQKHCHDLIQCRPASAAMHVPRPAPQRMAAALRCQSISMPHSPRDKAVAAR